MKRGGCKLAPPPPRGKKTLRTCARIHRSLVLNSYPDPPPPLSEILYPPLSKGNFKDTRYMGYDSFLKVTG